MRFFVSFITIFVLLSTQAICADWVYFFPEEETHKLSNDIVIYNALNLSDTQRTEVRENQNTLKKILSRNQKPKYSMIKRLERQNKKRPRNTSKYYKTNPLLHQFGDIKSIEHCEEQHFILK